MKKKLLFVFLGIALFVGLVAVLATSTNTATACPLGQCEPVYGWTYKDPVNVYSCSPGWTLDGTKCTHTETKPVDKWGRCPTGWQKDGGICTHTQTKDANIKSSCEVGYDLHHGTCRAWVQTGWNCNCGPDQHEENGTCVDNPPPPEMCTVPGLEGLTADDPGCVVPPEMCTVPGLEDLEATDEACVAPPDVVVPAPWAPPTYYPVCVDGETVQVDERELESYMQYPRGECKVVPVTGGSAPNAWIRFWQNLFSLFD